MNRRDLLAAGVVLAPGAAFAASAPVPASARAMAPRESSFLHFASPEQEFEAHFRFERDLRDEGVAVTWYHFTHYAIADGERPAPVIRYEGMEYSYFRRIAPQIWRIHAHNVSFPRALRDGEFASAATNPVTGETVQPPTMRLLEDPGVLYSPRGYLPLDSREARWLPSVRTFRIDGDSVVVDHVRPTPDAWPKMFIEASTSSVSRALFDDPRVTSLPCLLTGFYAFPWPKWMAMGARAGHMLGVWYGHKLRGVSELPEEFRARVERESPELLKPRWTEHDRPLSAVIREALK